MLKTSRDVSAMAYEEGIFTHPVMAADRHGQWQIVIKRYVLCLCCATVGQSLFFVVFRSWSNAIQRPLHLLGFPHHLCTRPHSNHVSGLLTWISKVWESARLVPHTSVFTSSVGFWCWDSCSNPFSSRSSDKDKTNLLLFRSGFRTGAKIHRITLVVEIGRAHV